ncbi:MAG: ATP-binding cassette domain-containing protein [Phycisphaerales bacterium]|nr:ATP-binding cassette domain-containing protein [Phycisphaerales bacterium]
MIELRNVEFSHDVHPGRIGRERAFVLDIQHLCVKPGERVACIGPSGSGKTTLLHLIAGVFIPQRGLVRVLGQELQRLPEPVRRDMRLRRIGMVFQEFELLEYLDALDNVLVGARISGISDQGTLRRRAERLAERSGLTGLLDRSPARLSQGERQRVAVCRALVTDPALILCDEPTGNLDPATTSRTLDLVLDHARETEATVVVVTHNHACLERFDRVIDMDALHIATAAPQVGAR